MSWSKRILIVQTILFALPLTQACFGGDDDEGGGGGGGSPRYCGDGRCNGSETCSSCSSDCGSCSSSCQYDCMRSPGCSEDVQRCSDQICTSLSTCCSVAPTRCDCPNGSQYPSCGDCIPSDCGWVCDRTISDGCGGYLDCACGDGSYCCGDDTGCCPYDTACGGDYYCY